MNRTSTVTEACLLTGISVAQLLIIRIRALQRLSLKSKNARRTKRKTIRIQALQRLSLKSKNARRTKRKTLRGKRKTTLLNQKMCCSDKNEEIKTAKKSKGVWDKSVEQSLKLLLRFGGELCSNERKDVRCTK
jgi:hypothetical protein